MNNRKKRSSKGFKQIEMLLMNQTGNLNLYCISESTIQVELLIVIEEVSIKQNTDSCNFFFIRLYRVCGELKLMNFLIVRIK